MDFFSQSVEQFDSQFIADRYFRDGLVVLISSIGKGQVIGICELAMNHPDRLADCTVLIDGEIHPIDTLDIGDDKHAFVFELEFLGALQGPLMVIIDNDDQFVPRSLGVIKVFNMSLVKGIEIP